MVCFYDIFVVLCCSSKQGNACDSQIGPDQFGFNTIYDYLFQCQSFRCNSIVAASQYDHSDSLRSSGTLRDRQTIGKHEQTGTRHHKTPNDHAMHNAPCRTPGGTFQNQNHAPSLSLTRYALWVGDQMSCWSCWLVHRVSMALWVSQMLNLQTGTVGRLDGWTVGRLGSWFKSFIAFNSFGCQN